VHPVGFITRIYHDARSPECQKGSQSVYEYYFHEMHKSIFVFQFVTQFLLPTQSSQVQCSPVGLTNAQQQLLRLITMAASGMHTHQQSQVKSSPTTVDDSKSFEAMSHLHQLDSSYCMRWLQF